MAKSNPLNLLDGGEGKLFQMCWCDCECKWFSVSLMLALGQIRDLSRVMDTSTPTTLLRIRETIF